MSRVSAFSIPGLDLWFNASDHLPPHFHVRKPGHWEIRIFFLLSSPGHLEFTVKWPPLGYGPRGRERRAILQATLEHRVELLAEWEQKVLVKEEG